MVAEDVKFESLGRYRSYLHLLADVEIGPRFRRKIDPSDLVQETLLKACQSLDGFQGKSDGELASWLRRILAGKIVDAIRELYSCKRDIRRERSLEEALDRSSARLQILANPGAKPSEVLARQENALKLADAIAGLPPDWRKALVLKHLHGWSLSEIAKDMGKTVFAVTGLLRRALNRLREDLKVPS